MKKNYNFIFISGVERSGTTFLAKKICEYKNYFFIPEAQWKKYIFSNRIDLIKKSFRFKIWGIDWNPKYDNLKGCKLYDEICKDYIKKKFNINLNDYENYTIVDHTPENFTYISDLKNWPNSKYVLLTRNSFAVSNSLLNTDWYSWDLSKLVKYQEWRESRIYKSISNENFSFDHIRYENILNNSDTWLAFLTKHNITVKSEETNTIILPKYTAHQHKLVLKEDNLIREFAWKDELDNKTFKYLVNDIKRRKIKHRFNFILKNPFKIISKKIERFFKNYNNA